MGPEEAQAFCPGCWKGGALEGGTGGSGLAGATSPWAASSPCAPASLLKHQEGRTVW